LAAAADQHAQDFRTSRKHLCFCLACGVDCPGVPRRPHVCSFPARLLHRRDFIACTVHTWITALGLLAPWTLHYITRTIYHLANLQLLHWLFLTSLLSSQGLQRMAAAWQAVPIRQPPTPVRQAAAFALTSSGPPLLYAAGGCHPDLLQVWDLTSEHVMQQVGYKCVVCYCECLRLCGIWFRFR
jgi:hypothetical protein